MMKCKNMTTRQITFITKLVSCIEKVGEIAGENTGVHLDLRELKNELEWYFNNRTKEI